MLTDRSNKKKMRGLLMRSYPLFNFMQILRYACLGKNVIAMQKIILSRFRNISGLYRKKKQYSDEVLGI